MSNEDIAYFRNEISRLNKIIEVLLDQNTLLKKGIAFAELGDMAANSGNAKANVSEDNTKEGKAMVDIGKGNESLFNALKEISKGNIYLSNAVPDFSKGTPNNNSGVVKVGEGNTSDLEPLPVYVEASVALMDELWDILKDSGFNKVSTSAINNASSRLLIHFYNRKGGSYGELRKLTKLSNYGLAKFIRSLKKRGLITRRGWQQFGLTSFGEDIVRAAWAKTDGKGTGG